MNLPFPVSYQVHLKGETNSNAIQAVANDLSFYDEVDDVSYGQAWVSNYSDFVKGISSFSWLLIFVIGASSFMVVGNAIRSSHSHRREEIEVLELLGESQSAIRRPYVIEGIVLGLLSSIAAIVVNIGISVFQAGIISESPMAAKLLQAQGLALSSWYILIPFVGCLVGAMGAWLAVRRFNTGWSAGDRSAA
jgi:cell division transport system permease protein